MALVLISLHPWIALAIAAVLIAFPCILMECNEREARKAKAIEDAAYARANARTPAAAAARKFANNYTY